jgi:hypothetical protein
MGSVSGYCLVHPLHRRPCSICAGAPLGVPLPKTHHPLLDSKRKAFIEAVWALDEEGFVSIAWGIYQQSKTAGGFQDKEGWRRVREEAEKLPQIAAIQGPIDEAYKKLDEEPPMKVVPVEGGDKNK